MPGSVGRITACRACGSAGLQSVLDLGAMPLADGLVDPACVPAEDPRYPLELAVCPGCGLAQLLETPPPDVLFGRDFPYYSSFLPQWLEHARAFAAQISGELALGGESLVVEVGSNDGYLLRQFRALGVPVLGADPAPGPAAAAVAAGVPTKCVFFSSAEAGKILRCHGAADLVVANNVLAHVPDPNELISGAARLLKSGGVFSIEVPSLRELVGRCAFDTIYHEHHAYFSVSSLAALLARHGLGIVRVDRLETHGGSLRITARPGMPHARDARRMMDEEAAAGLTSADGFQGFGERVHAVVRALRELLGGLRAAGKSLAAYGAAAKGAMLLNAAGIDRGLCDFVVDRNVHKHGLLIPGARVPIRPTSALLKDRPDYVLLLAWNWADEIRAQQREYVARGGRFIVPLPWPRVLDDG